jgi:putative ABC transport system substrate-binding protein
LQSCHRVPVSKGKLERFPALAAELVALNVDVIFAAGGTPAALAAKQQTQTIPIVFPAVTDPVAAGFVASLARPGGNVTGLSFITPELLAKNMELLTRSFHGSVESLSSGTQRVCPKPRGRPC